MKSEYRRNLYRDMLIGGFLGGMLPITVLWIFRIMPFAGWSSILGAGIGMAIGLLILFGGLWALFAIMKKLSNLD